MPARSNLYFFFGGYGPGRIVQLRRDKLWYCATVVGENGIDSETLLETTTEQWQTFWADLDQIGVWDWKSKYENLEILDGAWWSLRLRHNGPTLNSKGLNAYPGGDAQGNNPRNSAFNVFLKSLRRLCGGRSIPR